MATEPDALTEYDLSPEEFREAGYRTVDLLAEYYATLDERPVLTRTPPGDVLASFDEPLPEDGVPIDELLDAWEHLVIPNGTLTPSPRFFGFVMGSGTMVGTLAETLAAGLNLNAGGWVGGPAATAIERRSLSWLAEAIGYPDGGGILTSGGTMANVTALLTAFRDRAGYDSATEGLQTAREGRYRLYMADHEGHSSIVRAADILNLGRDAVRLVPSRDDFTMDPAALERFIEADLADGDRPFCVVGQVGSINVSAIDPLDAIAEVCERYDLWFHADGACGAVGAMLPELHERYVGLERADSVTLDPHKWLYVPYECGAVLFADPEVQGRAFAMHAGYLRGSFAEAPEEFSYYEHGPQMSRGFRALKLWSSLKHYGLAGYRDLLRRNNACAAHLHERVRAHEDFRPVQEPNLFIYSFQFVPGDLHDRDDDATAAYLDELNQAITDAIIESGLALVTTTLIHGRRTLRMSICSHRTRIADIDRVFDAMATHGARIDAERRHTLDG